jgi:hypothetical protein
MIGGIPWKRRSRPSTSPAEKNLVSNNWANRMAFYFTFAVECYREEDALRFRDRLRSHVLEVGSHQVPMAEVDMLSKAGLWYVFAMPKGSGYSQFGYGEGLNEPAAIRTIVDQLYEVIAGEPGVRRALCGYEAQDAFEDSWGNPDLNSYDIPDLVYDRSFGRFVEGTKEFGTTHYRNPPR